MHPTMIIGTAIMLLGLFYFVRGTAQMTASEPEPDEEAEIEKARELGLTDEI